MFGKKKKKKQDIAKSRKHVEEEYEPEEEEYSPSVRRPSKGAIFARIITGSLVLASFVMLCYSLFLLIHDSTVTETSPDSYITLHGKNVADSKKILGEFGTAKQNKAADIAVVGTKLFLSENKLTPSLLSSSHTQDIVGEGNSNFYLYNLTQSIPKFSSGQTDISNNIFYLELNNLGVGDYLIYSDTNNPVSKKDFNPYSLASGETINYTIYTLPDPQTRERRRITIKNNQVSPFLLINVQTAGSTLPESRYDAVIYNARYQETENQNFVYSASISEEKQNALKSLIDTSIDSSLYKVKFVYDLKEASITNAPLSFAVGSTSKDITSLFTINSNMTGMTSNVLTNTSLAGYDANPEVREMVGYLDRGGQYYLDVIGNDISSTTFTRVGKESFLLSESESLSEKINALLELNKGDKEE